MLIKYKGEVADIVQVGGGCSSCSKGRANSFTAHKSILERDYVLSNGRVVHFVAGVPVEVDDESGLALIELSYTNDGVQYPKFVVV